MFSSQNQKKDVVLALFKDNRTVFRLKDVAMLVGETNFQSLNTKLNYAVRTGKLQNPRKGIYAKPGYSIEELACSVYAPSYISLEYVLQKAGLVFQYDSGITSVSYLRRDIVVDGQAYRYRKIKGEILVNTAGILQQKNNVNIATPERAFLDMLYLSPKYYFDNLNPLNNKTVYKLLPVYQSKALTLHVTKLLQNA
ncbi:MAG TPA: hypothetical protein ENI57_09275 [Ignavibacteria bacterium]|nr:hypothetical protein [Ignavibacteria bacterium]